MTILSCFAGKIRGLYFLYYLLLLMEKTDSGSEAGMILLTTIYQPLFTNHYAFPSSSLTPK